MPESDLHPPELKLNIGAGITYLPGFKNIDVSPRAEICLDLNQARLPFADDSVDLVFSYHTLEHVQNYLFALGEIHRVLKHGGRLLLGVPYVTSTQSHLVNPYHRQNFNEHSFDFFDPAKNKGSAAEDNPILFQRVFQHYHYVGIFHLFPWPFSELARRHLINVVRKIDFGLLCVKDRSRIPEHDRGLEHRMRREFRDCLRGRIPYDSNPRAARQLPSSPMRHLRQLKHWWNATDV